MQISSNPTSALNIRESREFSRLKGNPGRWTRLWRQILHRKWKYGVSCMRNASSHNYWHSSFIVDLAMGDSTFHRTYFWFLFHLSYSCCFCFC